MAVMGRSAGGYYTLMALAHFPELWRAGVAIVPSYDLARDIAAMDADLRSYFEAAEFAPLTETGVIAALSPSTYVDRIRAPLFVYAGVHDVRSTVDQIDALVRDVRSRGRAVEYMREERAGHSEDPALVNLQRARILRFLRESMR
jgi:dipeptidyl aminopeptidase/acylaminoacyl peptidase